MSQRCAGRSRIDSMAATREARIRKWLRAKGYTLVPTRGQYSVCEESRRVYFRPGDSAETRVRSLLHECGHILLYRTMVGRSVLRDRYAGRYCGAAGRNRGRWSGASILDEELEAWYRGALLSERLGIRLDWKAYWRDTGASVFSYARALAAKRL